MVIKGCIEEIRYKNEENGYTIAVLDVKGEPVVCVGSLPPVSEGESLELEGEFVLHKTFGRQFKISSAKSAAPDTLDGIVRYLGSGLISGVGPKTALLIVNNFGEKTLEVIEFAPYMLSRIRGISRAKAEAIGEGYKAVKKMKDAVIFLQDNGVTTQTAVKIYKIYGENTQTIIKTNPYKLIDDIDGIGFLKADKIAYKMGIQKDSPFRVGAGVVHILKTSGEREGNTYLIKDELIEQTAKLLDVEGYLIEEIIEQLVVQTKLKREYDEEENEVYLLSIAYRAERGAAVKLCELVERSNKIHLSCEDEIRQYERQNDIQLHPQQVEAIRCAVKSGVSVITGGPGTGKTTILKCILSIFDSHKLSYTLMAPTGRAAKRMQESTKVEASTIHRALMISPSIANSGETTSTDVVIVDEFSMVDIYLFYNLVSKIREGSKLIIVGDKDQLPSVGAGNVLADILASGYIPSVNLTQVYRQAQQSLINVNAHLINSGKMPQLQNNSSDFFFMREQTQQGMANLICSLASERIPKYLGCEPSKIQVLSPVKNGISGTINLNKMLQARLNPLKNGAQIIESDGQSIQKGDRVMHTANNYSLAWKRLSGFGAEEGEGVFNGDMGEVVDIRAASGEVDVLFEDNRLVTYTRDILSQLLLAYAVTVHKSQGSEFDAVIMPIYGGNIKILTRNLLYTAITRAKKIVILVGEEYNIKKMVDNNYIAKRNSLLKKFILQIKEKYSILFGDSNDTADE